jgi:hypothetical protein
LSTRRLLTAASAALVFSVAFAALGERPGEAKEGDPDTQSAQVWRSSCQNCHTVPDATYETGRAFLAQITETS